MENKKNNKYAFKSEGEREVGVCIAIQKIGRIRRMSPI